MMDGGNIEDYLELSAAYVGAFYCCRTAFRTSDCDAHEPARGSAVIDASKHDERRHQFESLSDWQKNGDHRYRTDAGRYAGERGHHAATKAKSGSPASHRHRPTARLAKRSMDQRSTNQGQTGNGMASP
jgi:hypothetical protein